MQELAAKLHALYDSYPKWDPARADETRNAEDRDGAGADALKEQLMMLGYTAEDAEAEIAVNEEGAKAEVSKAKAKAKQRSKAKHRGRSKAKAKAKGRKAP